MQNKQTHKKHMGGGGGGAFATTTAKIEVNMTTMGFFGANCFLGKMLSFWSCTV